MRPLRPRLEFLPVAGVVIGLFILVLRGERQFLPVVVAAVVMFTLFGLVHIFTERHLHRQGFRPDQLPPSLDPGHTFDPERSARFRGGCRAGAFRATWPFITLRFDERWGHMSSGAGPFSLVPIWVDRTAVTGVRTVSGGAFHGRGIQFETRDGRYDGVIFVPRDLPDVLAVLRDQGWPVEDDRRNDPSQPP